MVEIVETIQKIAYMGSQWGFSSFFSSVLLYMSIITITFVAGALEDTCSSSSTITRSSCVSRMRQTEEVVRTLC